MSDTDVTVLNPGMIHINFYNLSTNDILDNVFL